MLSENAYGSPAGARLPGRTGCPGSARRANPSDSRPMVFLLRMPRSFRQHAMSREPSSTRLFWTHRLDLAPHETRARLP